ncbi:MAG: M23 family metallopeptidase [Planctomycetes bacterium]|nr:M23 family metallopeptidase [Planctomycetota bacterium]
MLKTMGMPSLLVLVLPLVVSAQSGTGGLGGSVVQSTGDCLSFADRQHAAAAVTEWFSAQPPESQSTVDPQQALRRYPLGALHREDMGISNYVDLDPTVGPVIDYRCGTRTYDGHDASDALIRSFDEQTLGVPIFAVADGVVIDTHDGEPDMNTVATGQPANYVIVDHGGGRVGYYWHVKNGSVVVSTGQFVSEGQELAMVGSSGHSNWPHLHFALAQNGSPIEPFAGPCNAGPSLWAENPAMATTTACWDAGISRTQPSAPGSIARDRELQLSDPLVYIWFHLDEMPANSTWRFIFERPNGTVAFDSGVGNFNNPQWGTAWFWFNWNVGDMHVLTGAWTIRVNINGTEVAVLPVQVVATLSGTNLPPTPITVAIDPTTPGPDEALRCRVTSSALHDDPDWDVVTHRFQWRVGGTIVRDRTFAARADFLPSQYFSAGDHVTCDVTPSDGQLTGPTAQASATVVTGFPGSPDGFQLRTGVGAVTSVDPHLVPVLPGDQLFTMMVSPSGAQVGKTPVLIAQFFNPGSPPIPPAGFPEFHLDLFQPILAVFNGNSSSPFGPILLPPGGMTFQFNVPGGLAGTSLMMQALVATNTAPNGFFSITNGKEIRFL